MADAADALTFKSRRQAAQYFRAVNDQARLKTVDTVYAHLPERTPLPPPRLARPDAATVRTEPYVPKG